MRMNIKFIGVFLLLLLLESSRSVVIKVENLPEQCDYSKCPQVDPEVINVHLVAHSHDDVGWLKTLDQYYYGSRNYIQRAGVQYILDTVIQELIRDKNRRFSYSETAFFWKWWKEQDKTTRKIVKELVRTGQLEFINGGWVMADEATTHYASLIDQFTWGLRRLNETFGRCGVPKVAWQIDPFGHSREFASLLAQMAYDALYFWREDYKERQKRLTNRTLEHVWQASDELGSQSDIFTGGMDRSYGPISGINWDILGDEDPIVDDPESSEYNLPRIIENFVNTVNEYSKLYATNHIMIPVGGDFTFQDAHFYFKNVDKLIKHIKPGRDGIRVFYSSPMCYTKALHESGVRFTGKTDDYFPYGSVENAYWTGFYTSRPTLKRFEREGNRWLQVCKQLDVLAGNGGELDDLIAELREAMGVMQHHDAITGTEKYHVAQDYAKLLHSGMIKCDHVISDAINRLLQFNNLSNSWQFCHQLNISACLITESGENLTMVLYNPLAHEVTKMVRLPVRGDSRHFQVLTHNGSIVSSSLVSIPDYVRQIPLRNSLATHELVFPVNLSSLGLAVFRIMTVDSAKNAAPIVKNSTITKETRLKSKNFELVLNSHGSVSHVQLANGKNVKLHQHFRFFVAADNQRKLLYEQVSGAYVFRPMNQTSYSLGKVIRANLYLDPKSGVQEVHQEYDSYVQQVIRVDPNRDGIEFDFVVGPIEVPSSMEGREIITVYDSNLTNGQTFYTDANGRQMMRREVNQQFGSEFEVDEPVAANLYPITSAIAIRDERERLQMTVLTDRAQAGTSLKDGHITMLVHRRLFFDDGFGVGEALDELGPDFKGLMVRARHLVLITPLEQAAQFRQRAQEMLLEPILAFLPKPIPIPIGTGQQWNLASTLPPNLHLLTLEQWTTGHYLLRLEHLYQKNEDAELSKPITVALRHLFRSFEVFEARELTLAANQPIEALDQRLRFDYTPVGEVHNPPPSESIDLEKLEVTLTPMQIRTFMIRVVRVKTV